MYSEPVPQNLISIYGSLVA